LIGIVRGEGQEPVGGLARLAGGADDGAIVLAQDLEPGADVIRVPNGWRDTERGAAEGGVDLGNIS